MTDNNQVLFSVENAVGWITLNRPEAHNALSYEMVADIRNQLKLWEDDNTVAFVCIVGAGGKALCAGADIRSLYQERVERGNAQTLARAYFSAEYEMDHMIHTYPKPCVVFMDGIVMGGGVGLAIGCDFRIVTPNTRWAMPEMNIGFFPDVGASYFLNKMPGHIGRYLALTSETIKAADTLYIGAADLYLPSESIKPCIDAIRKYPWQLNETREPMEALLRSFSEPCPERSALKSSQAVIDQHFAYDCVEKIMSSLNRASTNGCVWSTEKAQAMRKKSPTSLKVALEQLIRGKTLPLTKCFDMEVELSVEFMGNDDFFEGVRATLIDKDKNPRWNPERLEDVTDEIISAFFMSRNDDIATSSSIS